MNSDYQEYIHLIGNKLSPISVTLKRNGVATDLTGMTVHAAVYDEDGNAVVTYTATGVTVTSATDGEVDYRPQGDITTEGDYWLFFKVFVAAAPTVYDEYPLGRKFKIKAITVG